jgi:hypothetical protein
MQKVFRSFVTPQMGSPFKFRELAKKEKPRQGLQRKSKVERFIQTFSSSRSNAVGNNS